MTPSAYIALARDIAIVGALGVILWLVFRAGSDHVTAGDLKALQAQIATQAKITQGWKDQTDASNTHLASDLAAIRAASSAPVVHSWLLDAPACKGSGVLPPSPIQTPGGNSSSGSLIPGSGSNAEGHRRDAVIAAFKARWETVLASCRAEDQAWPR